MKDAMDILYCTAIYVAAQHGHRDTVKYLSEMDYTPSEDIAYKFAAFYLAAQNGLLDIIKYFMNNNFLPTNIMHVNSNSDEKLLIKIADNCVNIENEDKDGNTWLHYAAMEGDVAFVNHLLKKGANPRAINNYHDKPIHVAARNGCNNIVQILVEQGVNVNVTNKNKDTPLHYAVKNKHVIVVKELLKHGAKNLRNNYGYLPIHYSSSKKINLLLNQNGDDYKDRLGNTLLHIAALNGHVDVLTKLIQSKIKIDEKNKDGETALHLAVKHGQEKSVKILIENKASLVIKNAKFYTPCHTAISERQDNIAILLLEAVANCISKPDTFIHFAALSGSKKLVAMLIKKGFYATNLVHDMTPFMYAAKSGHAEICEMLLDCDVNIIDCTNKYKKTALHYAVLNNNVEVVKVLVKYEAKLLNDDDSNNPLYIAILKGFKSIEDILTKYQKNAMK